MFYYRLYNLLTAPGVVMHELSHAFFCLTAGVKIHRVKLFQFGKIAGYVEHEEPTKFYQGFLISLGPLILNSLFALLAFSQWRAPDRHWQPWVWLWLGIGVALHAIPSNEDANCMLHLANKRFWKNPLVMIGYPFVLILFILNLFKRVHVDWVFVGVLFWLGRFYL